MTPLPAWMSCTLDTTAKTVVLTYSPDATIPLGTVTVDVTLTDDDTIGIGGPKSSNVQFVITVIAPAPVVVPPTVPSATPAPPSWMGNFRHK